MRGNHRTNPFFILFNYYFFLQFKKILKLFILLLLFFFTYSVDVHIGRALNGLLCSTESSNVEYWLIKELANFMVANCWVMPRDHDWMEHLATVR